MTPFVQIVTEILSLFTLGTSILVGTLGGALILKKFGLRSKAQEIFIKFFAKHAIPISFLVALSSLLGSLFYSEIAGFAPCVLCWWARIFIYPQVIIFGFALWKKTRDAEVYGVTLSSLGAIVSLYATYLQFGGTPLVPCSANVLTTSCAQRYFLEYGYITIPTMGLVAFLLILVMLIAHRTK